MSITRRGFLGALASVPLIGWAFPKKAALTLLPIPKGFHDRNVLAKLFTETYHPYPLLAILNKYRRRNGRNLPVDTVEWLKGNGSLGFNHYNYFRQHAYAEYPLKCPTRTQHDFFMGDMETHLWFGNRYKISAGSWYSMGGVCHLLEEDNRLLDEGTWTKKNLARAYKQSGTQIKYMFTSDVNEALEILGKYGLRMVPFDTGHPDTLGVPVCRCIHANGEFNLILLPEKYSRYHMGKDKGRLTVLLALEELLIKYNFSRDYKSDHGYRAMHLDACHAGKILVTRFTLMLVDPRNHLAILGPPRSKHVPPINPSVAVPAARSGLAPFILTEGDDNAAIA